MTSPQFDDCDSKGPGCTRNTAETWYCVDCQCSLCELCWPQVLPHTGGRTGRDGPHEQVQHHIYLKLKAILEPKYDESDLEELHRRDLDTTWFGIRRDSTGQPLLADYDVYSTLLRGPLINSKDKYPQLVSFIGQTNAGKSTLIKMLIELHEQSATPGDLTFPSPVVGLPRLEQQSGQEDQSRIPLEHIPTSADVHLYADPVRFNKKTPLLYADCEGLTGGENPPIGAQENRTSLFTTESSIARLTPGRLRPLAWADTEKKRTRGFFVRQMYPRILYTLSDVVVFVVPDANSKTFEVTTLRPLLEWADASLETSINQPTLPHAIIALNGSDPSSNKDIWDSEFATWSLLEANKHCLDRRHHYFANLADEWREKGKRINTILDLIHCYYSTFRVIRIPRKGRYQLLHSQIENLHGMITAGCKSSFDSKRQANMLWKSHEMHVYFQSAFDHFAETLDRPFNFIAVSLLNNPIPDDFGGHILQLAIAIQAHDRQHQSTWIFDQLAKLVASSVLLDCVRNRKAGMPEDLFVHYENYCRNAIEGFWRRSTPCDFHIGHDHCVNVASNHDPKGHQNAKGKIIAAGEFVSSFQPIQYFPRWTNRIKAAIRQLNSDLQKASRGAQSSSKDSCLLRIHSNNMHRFFVAIGPAGHFLSHATCFCCLMQSPQHVLRCGHVLCTQCVRAYGKSLVADTDSKSVVSLDCCPLHPAETQWRAPCIIRFKPDHAGVRLLCLDGGGMRGIVELEVLRAIQNQIGNRVPVQAFFDLIVGTSTGGIIALAFGVKNWSIRRCADRFRKLCGAAFTPRLMQAIPILKYIITLKLASRYQTTPLRKALKSSLGEQPLFGNNGRRRSNHSAKIAVTATDQAGTRPIIIANYSRKDSNSVPQRSGEYEFLRPDGPDQELTVWEAAAATSAAPSYFRPFEHAPTKRTYLDGAIYHNNPVRLVHRERKLLWPDVADRDPDIFLSIGTSQNVANMRRSLSSEGSSSRANQRTNATETDKTTRLRKRAFPKVRQIFTTMHNRIDSILDAELAWKDFCKDIANVDEANKETSRYVRINPGISYNPPSLDDVRMFKRLQRDVRRELRSADSRAETARVTHMLIASSFYYE
ncbi:FabD/lysophospholipase-like protein, partial [Ophiobolus disseminans]